MSKNDEQIACCSFCGLSESRVQLIAGPRKDPYFSEFMPEPGEEKNTQV